MQKVIFFGSGRAVCVAAVAATAAISPTMPARVAAQAAAQATAPAAQTAPPRVAPAVTPATTPSPPDLLATPYTRGIAAYQNKDPETAITLLTEAVAKNPKLGDAQAVLGFLLAQQNKYDVAIPHLEQATQYDTNLLSRADTLMNLGKALLMRPNSSVNDMNRAVDLFEQATKAAKPPAKSVEAQMALGYGYTRQMSDDKAAAAYRQATVLDPKNASAWKSLGITLRRQGKDDEAADALQKAAALNSQDVDTWATLGGLELKRNDNAAAQNALETARKLNSKDPTVLIGLGVLYSHQNNPADAADAYGAAADQIDAMTAAGKTAPPGIDLARLRYDQGVTLAQAGKKDEASAAYDKALAINPRYYEALLNSGTMLYRDHPDDAISRFKAAAEVKPDSALVWKNLAAAYTRKGDEKSAADALRKVCSLEPTNYEVRDQLVSALLPTTPTSDEIVKLYKQMASLRPYAADPLIGLGLLYERQVEVAVLASTKQARLLLAMNCMKGAIAREPHNATAYNDLGVVHERRGEMDEAVIDYKKAVAFASSFPNTGDPTLENARKNLARFHAAPGAPVSKIDKKR